MFPVWYEVNCFAFIKNIFEDSKIRKCKLNTLTRKFCSGLTIEIILAHCIAK